MEDLVIACYACKKAAPKGKYFSYDTDEVRWVCLSCYPHQKSLTDILFSNQSLKGL